MQSMMQALRINATKTLKETFKWEPYIKEKVKYQSIIRDDFFGLYSFENFAKCL
jgi:hypothetical protein